MVKIGVIGYGYWGPNLVRNFFLHDEVIVKTVADLRADKLALLKKIYPSVTVTTNYLDILQDNKIDAVAIATPVKTHYRLAKEAIQAGKHVLIEKPMTDSFIEGQKLVDLALKKKKVLMVDHTFIYTSAVRKIKNLIEKGEIGKMKYFDSIRTNLGIFQEDINVLWDLASHDLSILQFLHSEKPHSVQAVAASHTRNAIENIGFLILKYKSGLIAHFDASWSTPVKIRMTIIGGDRKMIVYNDVEPTEKVKVYSTGFYEKKDVDKLRVLIQYREGDIYVPKVESVEALEYMTGDFIKSIKSGHEPLSNWKLGLEVVKILTLSDKSLKKGGKEVKYNE